MLLLQFTFVHNKVCSNPCAQVSQEIKLGKVISLIFEPYTYATNQVLWLFKTVVNLGVPEDLQGCCKNITGHFL